MVACPRLRYDNANPILAHVGIVRLLAPTASLDDVGSATTRSRARLSVSIGLRFLSTEDYLETHYDLRPLESSGRLSELHEVMSDANV